MITQRTPSGDVGPHIGGMRAEKRTERRRLFSAAVAILGYSMGEAAARVGCTPNHLLLVLDGVRTPSTRLDAEIRAILRDAKPELLAALEKV